MNYRTPVLLLLLPTLMALAGCEDADEGTMVGTLERDRVELTVDSNEPIVARHVPDGAAVTKGTLIMEQETSRIVAQLEQSEAARDQAAGRLAELRRGPREEAIRETRARLDAARAQSTNAKSEYERVKGVFDRGLSTAALLEQTETSWRAAAANERAVHEELAAQLEGTTVEELDQAEAALAVAEAATRQAAIQLERTRLVAPVDGTVDKLLYQVGERPAPGATVAVMLDSARAFARIYVPEHLRAHVKPGDQLEVAIDGVDTAMQGTVKWVSSDATFTPYFALTEHDRSRLSYLAEVDLAGAAQLPSGVPLEARIPAAGK